MGRASRKDEAMLAAIKRLRARLFDSGSKPTRRRKERTDPLLSGPPQPDARLRDARGQTDPNARFPGVEQGRGGMGGDAGSGGA
jgi:hypothetical protein